MTRLHEFTDKTLALPKDSHVPPFFKPADPGREPQAHFLNLQTKGYTPCEKDAVIKPIMMTIANCCFIRVWRPCIEGVYHSQTRNRH